MTDILGIIIEYFFSIFPRFQICQIDEAVSVNRGNNLIIKRHSTFYWPWCTEVAIWNMTHQVSGGHEQKATTLDNKTIAYEIFFYWKNTDIKSSQVDFGEEPISAINSYITHLVCSIASSHSFSTFKTNSKKINDYIQKKVSKKFSFYGEISDTYLVGLVEVNPILHMGGAEFANLTAPI